MSLSDLMADAIDNKSALEKRTLEYNDEYLTPFATELAQIAVAIKMTLESNLPDEVINRGTVKLEHQPLKLTDLEGSIEDEFFSIRTGYASLEIKDRDWVGSRELRIASSLSQVTHDEFSTFMAHQSKKTDPECIRVNDGNSHYLRENGDEHISSKPTITNDSFAAIMEHFLDPSEKQQFIDNYERVKTDPALMLAVNSLVNETGSTEVTPDLIEGASIIVKSQMAASAQ